MAEIVSSAGIPKGPSAGATASGYQWLFLQREGTLYYYQWTEGSKRKQTATKVLIGDSVEVKVGTAGINVAVTKSGDLRIYLIFDDNRVAEIVLVGLGDKDAPEWEFGDLYNKAQYRAAAGSTLSIVDNPLQVIFTERSQLEYPTAAYWNGKQWDKKVLENLQY